MSHAKKSAPVHRNRLADETSPYLLQHAANPIDWFPWGDEAFEKARREDRPVFLSVGYAACHWCHVMAHESFEDETIAAFLNQNFVSIKVDREERPDVDEIYMNAVQMISGSGGWPMTVFLTPDRKPFFGGTYFPPTDRYGRPGFPTLLRSIATTFRTRRSEVEHSAEQIAAQIRKFTAVAAGGSKAMPTRSVIEDAISHYRARFDAENGGFGEAPKFPPSMALELLLTEYVRASEEGRATAGAGDTRETETLLPLVTRTLDKMAMGGLYDQLGGGFARYSTDPRWLVPHFEKMLYDNALLARVYVLAYEETKDPEYRRVAEETFAFVARELTGPSGGFFSSLDADSEGHEGKYYLFGLKEVEAVLGTEDARLFCEVYGVTPAGNFEGETILNLPIPLSEVARAKGTSYESLVDRLRPLREKLHAARWKRVHPGLDDKVVTAWNALMIRALAEGHRVLGRAEYRVAAERAAAFLLSDLSSNGRLLRTHRAGKSQLNAYLEDHAYLIHALLALHRATNDARWKTEAERLGSVLLERFGDERDGGFFFTSSDHETLIARTKSAEDNATPSGNAMAVRALVALDRASPDDRFREAAARTLACFADRIRQYPHAFPEMLIGLREYLAAQARTPDRVSAKPVVTAEARVKPDVAGVGTEATVAVTIRIAPGYHVNAEGAADAASIPTRAVFRAPDFLMIAPARFPKPLEIDQGGDKLQVYMGEITVVATLLVRKAAPRGTKVPFACTLSFQPCSESACLAPATLELPLEIDIAAEGATK